MCMTPITAFCHHQRELSQKFECRDRTNLGFEITGNVFKNIRDNPIEPEGHAAFWIIKQNSFINVHAVSTDGVAGHDLLVFGNIFAQVGIPGSSCRDEGWAGSRQFLAKRGGGKWSTVAEGDEADCSTHRFGTAVKLGGDDGEPLLERVLFFNNSLLTRSPLFRGSPGPPITSYNNAVTFIGCGTDGDVSCRQVFDCADSTGRKMGVRCSPTASMHDKDGRPLAHHMRFNAYNRVSMPRLEGSTRSGCQHRSGSTARFLGHGKRGRNRTDLSIGPDSPLAHAGCQLRYARGS